MQQNTQRPQQGLITITSTNPVAPRELQHSEHANNTPINVKLPSHMHRLTVRKVVDSNRLLALGFGQHKTQELLDLQTYVDNMEGDAWYN